MQNSLLGNLKTHLTIVRTLFKDDSQFSLVDVEKHFSLILDGFLYFLTQYRVCKAADFYSSQKGTLKGEWKEGTHCPFKQICAGHRTLCC